MDTVLTLWIIFGAATHGPLTRCTHYLTVYYNRRQSVFISKVKARLVINPNINPGHTDLTELKPNRFRI